MSTATLPAAEPEPNVRTIADLPFHVMGRYQKAMAMGRCRGTAIEGMSSKEVFERVRDISFGLAGLGVARGDRVAIVSESRPEWVLADLAVLALGAVLVPVYPTLSGSQAKYILQDCGAGVVIVSTETQLEKIEGLRPHLPAVKAIVVIEPGDVPHAPHVLSLDELGRRGHGRMTGEWGAGRDFRETARQVQPADLATIIYTSGTTGEPKGVMLTHANLVSNMFAGAEVLKLGQEDVAVSFLPLSHAFERMVSYIYLLCGVTFVFAESLETIARDVSAVRPTVFTGVPRVYEKIHARVLEKGQAGSAAKAALFRWAVGVANTRGRLMLRGRQLSPLASVQVRLADKLVFSKVRAGMGGRVRYLVSGSAPLPVSTAEFFYGVGLPIVEGYGLTETAPILTVNPPDAPRAGTVGRAIRDVQLRIAADGEILARGPNIMSGYYNKPEATAEVIRDGWFHTGDIGSLDADGHLAITDRKKDLLVTSGGKKIAPQPIENALKQSPLVAEAVVLGDRRRYAVALVVPEFGALERRLQELGAPPAGRAALVTRPDVVALYQPIIDELNTDLAQFERIKRIALLPREFSMDRGELTPSLKVRRKIVEEQWRGEIEALYQE
ncbi:AMP-dependent synthetase/ligase [soil metagenome]